MAEEDYKTTGDETGFILKMPFLEVEKEGKKARVPYIGKIEIYKGIGVEEAIVGLIYSAAALAQDEGKSYFFTPELLEQLIKNGEERNQEMKKEIDKYENK